MMHKVVNNKQIGIFNHTPIGVQIFEPWPQSQNAEDLKLPYKEVDH
jgi:hypothetical protein